MGVREKNKSKTMENNGTNNNLIKYAQFHIYEAFAASLYTFPHSADMF